MARPRPRFRPSNLEIFVALRFKIRALGLSRVDTLVLERDLSEPIPLVQTKVPVEMSVLTSPSDARELASAEFWEGYEGRLMRRLSPAHQGKRVKAREEEFARRLQAGEVVAVARLEGKYIGAAWFCLSGEKVDPVINMAEPIGSEEAYLYQAQVERALRGRGVYGGILVAGLRYLKAQGIRRIKVHIEDDNLPSLAASAKLGFKPVRLIRFRRLFSRERREVEDIDGVPAMTGQEERI